MLKELIKPDMIDISNGLCGSKLNKSETEQVVCNIIALARKQGDWFSFTWEGYRELCDHNPSRGEKHELDRLSRMKFLNENGIIDDVYSVTDLLIAELWEFVNNKEPDIEDDIGTADND